jgi:hypothetical protein
MEDKTEISKAELVEMFKRILQLKDQAMTLSLALQYACEIAAEDESQILAFKLIDKAKEQLILDKMMPSLEILDDIVKLEVEKIGRL